MKNILKRNRKGQLQALPMSIILLVVAGVFLVLGLIILEAIRNTEIVRTATDSTNCTATNSSQCGIVFSSANNTVQGLASFGDFFTIIVLAVVISLVIGLLLSMFGSRRVR